MCIIWYIFNLYIGYIGDININELSSRQIQSSLLPETAMIVESSRTPLSGHKLKKTFFPDAIQLSLFTKELITGFEIICPVSLMFC